MSALDWFMNTPEKHLEILEAIWQVMLLGLCVVGFFWISRGGCND